MGKTTIEWCDVVWNPLRGCSKVSSGCQNCYAMRMAARYSGPGLPYDGLASFIKNKEPRRTGEVRFVEEHLNDPLHWKKPKRIFVNSMSDLFHEKVKDEWLLKIWGVMANCFHHSFLVLTKRPHLMMERIRRLHLAAWPQIWLGVSVEDQATAKERIPILLQTPALVRWISYETN